MHTDKLKVGDYGNQQQKIDHQLLTELMTRQLRMDVESFIYKQIQPHVKGLVKQLAAEAVKSWATNIRTEKVMVDPFDQTTRIEINFVEEIIRTEVRESDIKIVVNDVK